MRAPSREISGLIRAHHDEAEGTGATSFAPSPQPPAEAVDSHSRYKRPAAAPAFVPAAIAPVPDVPGIVRAHREEADALEEAAKPTPLFSNEGIVRESQARLGNRVLAPITGFFGALLDAGSALGHSLGSHSPGMKPAIASPILSGADPGSPDFDRFGNPRVRGRRRRRTAAAMLLGGLVIVGVLGLTLSSVLLPTPDNNGFPHSPGTSGNPIDNWNGQMDGNTTADPNALPSGVAIGDDPLAPGATRRPGGGVATSAPTPSGSFCWTMPAPSATASASASGSTSPGPSSSASSSASVTPRPSPTPIKTTCPAPLSSHNPTPQPSLTPTPTATPIPTPTLVPTPSPTPEMLAVIYSVTPPAVARTNGEFIVGSLPGATCRLWLEAPIQWRSATLPPTDSDGWVYVWWGAGWPEAVVNMTVTVYATCTAAAPDSRTATSDQVSVSWPPLATPTPTPATT